MEKKNEDDLNAAAKKVKCGFSLREVAGNHNLNYFILFIYF